MTNRELQALWGLFDRVSDFRREVLRTQFNDLLSRGKIQLWVVPDALDPEVAMVTELHETQDDRYVEILALVGERPANYSALLRSMMKWAKRNNCTRIRAICEDAQMRLFARDGFVKYANAIELEIPNETN
jgi:hypothetical protein